MLFKYNVLELWGGRGWVIPLLACILLCSTKSFPVYLNQPEVHKVFQAHFLTSFTILLISSQIYKIYPPWYSLFYHIFPYNLLNTRTQVWVLPVTSKVHSCNWIFNLILYPYCLFLCKLLYVILYIGLFFLHLS